MTKAFKLGVVFLGLGIAIGAWQYFRPAKDRAQDEPMTAASAGELHEILSKLPPAETHEWLNETLLIEGEVVSADQATILLSPGVACAMQPGNIGQPIAIGENVVIKGRVLGYDDLFDEVQVDFGQIMEPS